MIKINESTFPLKDGTIGKIGILMYSGTGDPKIALNKAVSQYTKQIEESDKKYIELRDTELSNPWMRVVISGVNKMNQTDFDPKKHNINFDGK